MVSDNTGPPETGLEKIRQKRSLLPPPPLTEKRLKGREAREASGGRSPPSNGQTNPFLLPGLPRGASQREMTFI